MKCFLLRLQTTRLHRDVDDRVIWTALKSGNFSVKSLYSVLKPSNHLLFPNIVIWRSHAPPRVAFFTWEATWGKVLILDQVQRRGFFWLTDVFFVTPNKKLSIIFFFTMQNCGLFGNCFFSLFKVSWVLSFLVKETLLGWHGPFVGKVHKKAW